MRHAYITGSAGFIGFYLLELLLQEGWSVTGLDGLTDYYDVRLKQRRLQMLGQHENFHPITAMLEDEAVVMESVAQVNRTLSCIWRRQRVFDTVWKTHEPILRAMCLVRST